MLLRRVAMLRRAPACPGQSPLSCTRNFPALAPMRSEAGLAGPEKHLLKSPAKRKLAGRSHGPTGKILTFARKSGPWANCLRTAASIHIA
jgi:hypothetical protein